MSVSDLFADPEATCPRCGGDFRWRDASLGSRAVLVLGRVLARLARRLLGLRLWCRACSAHVSTPCVLPRTVMGFHGCDRAFAADLVSGRLPLAEWQASRRDFEWLGEGIYFWEHAPGRAWQWAEEHHPGREAVVAVEIRLGRCLDLADTDFAPLLRWAYDGIVRVCQTEGRAVPRNTVGRDHKARRLDCLVLNRLMAALDQTGLSDGPRLGFQTIRSPFEEGDEVYPGAKIRAQSHVQIVVRDRACLIPGVRGIPRRRPI